MKQLLLASALIACLCSCRCQQDRSQVKTPEQVLLAPASNFQPSFTSSDSNPSPGKLSDSSKRSSERALNNILDAFKVQDSTIIRTKESRAAGARYLNESRLQSREQCMTWCAEYQNIGQGEESVSCNVAVFEENGKNSCYLFDCGHTEQLFKCQFTPLAGYTSAVLNRASIDLSEWREQSTHAGALAQVASQRRSTSNQVTERPIIAVDKKNSELPVGDRQRATSSIGEKHALSLIDPIS